MEPPSTCNRTPTIPHGPISSPPASVHNTRGEACRLVEPWCPATALPPALAKPSYQPGVQTQRATPVRHYTAAHATPADLLGMPACLHTALNQSVLPFCPSGSGLLPHPKAPNGLSPDAVTMSTPAMTRRCAKTQMPPANGLSQLSLRVAPGSSTQLSRARGRSQPCCTCYWNNSGRAVHVLLWRTPSPVAAGLALAHTNPPDAAQKTKWYECLR